MASLLNFVKKIFKIGLKLLGAIGAAAILFLTMFIWAASDGQEKQPLNEVSATSLGLQPHYPLQWPAAPTSFLESLKNHTLPPIKNTFRGGELRRGERFDTLVLEGTPTQMGIQYGYLEGERINEFLTLFEKVAFKEGQEKISNSQLRILRRWIAERFWAYIPEESRAVMMGMVHGAKLNGVDLNLMDVVFLNSLIDVAAIVSTDLSLDFAGFDAAKVVLTIAAREVVNEWFQESCNSFAAFGARTSGGKTFQTRNADVATGLGVEKFPLVVVYKPKSDNGDKLAPYVAASFVGQIGVFTGMNSFGVGLGQVWAFSNSKAVGTPWPLAMRTVMSHSTTATQAAIIFSSFNYRTYGNNFIFADATGDAIAIEANSKHIDFFRANDSRELSEGKLKNGDVYAIIMPDALFRADFSMSQKLRREQTSSRGPEGDPRVSTAYKKRYLGQAILIEEFEKLKTPIGQVESEAISRQTASRDGNLQNAVYANSDLKMWVSYASIEGPETLEHKSRFPVALSAKSYSSKKVKRVIDAYENPYVEVPFLEYLKYENVH